VLETGQRKCGKISSSGDKMFIGGYSGTGTGIVEIAKRCTERGGGKIGLNGRGIRAPDGSGLTDCFATRWERWWRVGSVRRRKHGKSTRPDANDQQDSYMTKQLCA